MHVIIMDFSKDKYIIKANIYIKNRIDRLEKSHSYMGGGL